MYGYPLDQQQLNEELHHVPQKETNKREHSSTTACEACKRRKVRCDRAEPSCGWCVRNNQHCVYPRRQKPGFRAGYLSELETKVDRVEAELHALSQAVGDHLRHSPREKQPSMSIPFGSANFPDGLQGPASTPSSSTDPSSRSDNMRPADRLKSHPMPPHAADMPRVGRLNVSQPSSCSASDLPSHDQLFVLADLYFKHVNTWCPILDRNATIDLLSDLSALDESERVLIHAIVAVAMRFYPGGFLEEDTRNHYYAVARRKVLLQALEKPSMKSLQALVILTLDIHGTPEIDPSGNMLALTARIALQLRLHVERGISLVDASASPSIALPKPTSWRENESRRRLFWTVYTVDRYASLAANSDFIVREETVDRFLPSRYDLFSEDQSVETRWYDGPGRSKCLINHPENLGSFSYHCEILRTLSQIYNFLKKPIDIFSDGEVENWWKSYRELDSELNIWLADLPGDFSNVSKLCHSDPTSRISNWIILHGAFVTAVVRLHSCAAYPIASSHLFAPFVSASQKCLAAVGSLKEITQDAAKTGMLPLLGPQFAYALWVAARLLLLHAASTGGEVGDLYHSFAMTLGQMGQYWPVAHKYSQQLHKTRERSSPTDGTYGRSPSVELAAMRRRSYEISLFLHHPADHQRLSVPALTTEDLEAFEVFDFFNYPRLPACMINNTLPEKDSAL